MSVRDECRSLSLLGAGVSCFRECFEKRHDLHR
jgi:hypothetical protein